MFNVFIQLCTFNGYNFSKNVPNYVLQCTHLSKNIHNFAHLMYTILQRMYTILNLQYTQFFKNAPNFVHTTHSCFMGKGNRELEFRTSLLETLKKILVELQDS